MQIKIKTSVDNVSAANYLLKMAISSFSANKENFKKLDITPNQVKAAQRFLNSCTNALIKSIENERVK